MMKKFFCLVLILFSLFTSNALAESGKITVWLNGDKLQFEKDPVIVDGVTLVPMRLIFEKLGSTVTWINTVNSVKATKGNTEIILDINKKTAYINSKPVQLEVPATLIDGSTFVPLRFVAESLDQSVVWADGTIYVNNNIKINNTNNDTVENKKITYQNGIIYEGDIINNVPNGKGTLTFVNGSKYEGSFQNGKFNGQGVLVYASGERYEGEFQLGNITGKGKFTLPDGGIIEGIFLDGKLNGLGSVVNKYGEHIGNWKNGERDGYGVFKTKDGFTLAGNWVNGIYSGNPGTNNTDTSITPTVSSSPSTSSVIETKMDGDFEGWEGDTIFKLANGQIWQQTEYNYNYHYAYRPDVLIYKDGSGYRMKVDGVDKAIGVKRIK